MQEHFVLLCNSTDVGEDTDLFFLSFGLMLQDMSLTVALNNIQSVDRGEDEKVIFLKLNLS